MIASPLHKLLVSTDLLLDTSVFNTVELRLRNIPENTFALSWHVSFVCADCNVGSTAVVHTVDSSDIWRLQAWQVLLS